MDTSNILNLSVISANTPVNYITYFVPHSPLPLFLSSTLLLFHLDHPYSALEGWPASLRPGERGCVCVCVCMHACVHVCACVHTCGVRACIRVRACKTHSTTHTIIPSIILPTFPPFLPLSSPWPRPPHGIAPWCSYPRHPQLCS